MSSYTDGPATFLERYLNGEVLADDIDDFIDRWHENPEGREIYEFLGMSNENIHFGYVILTPYHRLLERGEQGSR